MFYWPFIQVFRYYGPSFSFAYITVRVMVDVHQYGTVLYCSSYSYEYEYE